MTTLLMMRTDKNNNQCQSSGMNGDERLPTALALLGPSLSPPTTVIPSTQELPSSMGGIVTENTTTNSSNQIQNAPQKRKKNPTLDNAPSSDVAGHDDDGGTNKKTKHSGRNQTAQTTGGGGNEISAAEPTSMQAAFQAFLHNAAHPPPPPPPPPGALFQYLSQFQHPQPPPGLFLFSPLPYYPTHPLHHPHGCYNQHNYRHDGHVTNEAVENELYSNDGWLDGEEAKAAKAAERQQKKAKVEEAKAAKAAERQQKKAKVEEARRQEVLSKQHELSVKVEDETDEKLEQVMEEGYYECDALIDDLILATEENNDNGKSFKSIEKQLRDEHSRLDDINIESIGDYLNNLRRRKKFRGRSDNEKTRMVTQQLQDEKKQFDEMAKEQHKSIQEEFGDYPEFQEKLERLIFAVADSNRDCSLVTIEGHLGGFKEEDASEIALEQTEQMLDLAVKEFGLESSKDFLPNETKDLQQFVSMFEGDDNDKLAAMKILEQLALDKGKKDGASLLNEGEIEENDHFLLGTVSFLSSYGINISYDDIRQLLVDGLAGVIRHPTTNELMIYLRIGNALQQQGCIGKLKQAGGKLDDFNTTSFIEGNYVLQVFPGGTYPRLYKVTGNKIRRIKFHAHVADNLLSFRCNLTRDKTQESEKKFKSDQKMWTLHQLTQLVLHNHGRGMLHNKLLREHYGLKDGETFEDKVKYYDYNPEAAKKRRARLIAKGWEGVGQASWCDYDHLLKRTRAWMNASIFTMPCSHSWNQCVAKIRQRMGCWGFGFAYIKYNGGN